MKLGLIGKGILNSSSPDLHMRLGRLIGIETHYELLDASQRLDARQASLEAIVGEVTAAGYRGVNVTYPFKEQAIALADQVSPGAAMVGSANTLVFQAGGMRAENTDFTGFISGYRATFGDQPPGRVLLIGTGGVGKAVAFGVAQLGATEVLLVDIDIPRAEHLAAELAGFGFHARSLRADQVAEHAPGCDGLINCTPIGHEKSPGCPLPPELVQSHHWVFDAVYVPAMTEFITAAKQVGARVMSGVSLFVFQGVDAFKHFCEDDDKRAAVDQQTAALFAHYRRQLLGHHD